MNVSRRPSPRQQEEEDKVKKRIEKLKKVINYHRHLYHVLDRQEISDAALDSLKHDLDDLESRFPQFITADSPTQRVGGERLDKFVKIKHKVRQWSFNDAFTEQEMMEFDARVKRMIGKTESVEYTCELKIDGFKIVLTYENGVLKTAATRGDGVIGEDVTMNVKTIESIPLRLEEDIDIIVEGEIWMSKDEFERLNAIRKKAGEPLYANPRNIATGSIRQLDPKIAASRRLNSFLYDISYINKSGKEKIEIPKTQVEELQLLKKLGFKVNPHFKLCKDMAGVIDFWREWQNKKEKMDYWIDGVAVKVNKREWQGKLGYTGKAPRFAIAFKFPAEQATTVIENIEVQVGRTGVLTPVAHLKPVLVAGSVVSRATLHNEEEIKRLGVRVGDTVIIQKAGDIIPEVVEVIKDLRSGKEKSFKMPSECPICGSVLAREEGSPLVKCSNRRCAVRHRRALSYFVSKKAFNVDGMGPKVIDALLDNELIADAADLFDLKEGDLFPLERFAEKSAGNLIKAINERREIELSRFVIALGIPNVGESTARDLADKFGDIENLRKADLEELEKIRDIGGIVAKSVYDWFRDGHNKKLLEKLLKRIEVKKTGKPRAPGKLKGLKFVLTGSLSLMPRDEAKEKIRALGGEVSESVSGKTDFVVYGKDPGSKYERAKKLGVKTLNEKDFLGMIK